MAILRAVAINAFPLPTLADSRRWNAPKAVLVMLIGTAAIQKELPALVPPVVSARKALGHHRSYYAGLTQARRQNAWR